MKSVSISTVTCRADSAALMFSERFDRCSSEPNVAMLGGSCRIGGRFLFFFAGCAITSRVFVVNSGAFSPVASGRVTETTSGSFVSAGGLAFFSSVEIFVSVSVFSEC